MNPPTQRIDAALVEKGLAQSRDRAKRLVMSGRVLVNDIPVDKPGTQIAADAVLTIKGEEIPYVSRGGLKLERALEIFGIDPNGMVCMDVGASTGGFTDCLLQRGAERVFAVDVGYGQLAWSLRQNPRVVLFERTNIRRMSPTDLPEPVDLAVIDVSFISLRIVVPVVQSFLKTNGTILALIKPQFEVGKGRVGKGGVVRDAALHDEVIRDLTSYFSSVGLDCREVIPSPIHGAKGNREFLIHLGACR
ncbi:MAG: TlyA family RNA methyltransferase [Desulfobacterales bacterium]|jgi:23S rRNA (cytidine1920-2'-O)/16S rRNA (cytidine1409-2'-O)-methyltransferase